MSSDEITVTMSSDEITVTMSSDEDFSLVMNSPQPSEDTLEGIAALISNYKKKHEQLIEEQKELAISRDERQELTKKFKMRSDKVTRALKEDRRSYKERIENEKARVDSMKQEERELMKEIQKVQAALKEQEAKNIYLKEQADVFTGVPETSVVFQGSTGAACNTQTFDMTAHIVYPMEGGTALVTYEEEVVAKKILSMKTHQVALGSECSITVEARPVQLMVPNLVEVDSEVCPRRILISNLPKMDTDILLNKLEIHFAKTRHGGGEVDACEMLPDSGTVVLTFLENDIARRLTDKEYHEVNLLQEMHRVRVTPFLNGSITNLKTKMAVCPRTVLLMNIPAVMEQENLQDLLEIHFQKSSNGGGEIEAFHYNPVGQRTSALFE